jgi:hypothetical protein
MTQTKDRATSAVARKQPGHEGQTFLVGDLVYLRGMEVSDGKTVTSWRDSPFPVSTDRGEEIIKQELAKEYQAHQQTLAIVRKADDRVVGSMAIQHWRLLVHLKVHIDPILVDAPAL